MKTQQRRKYHRWTRFNNIRRGKMYLNRSKFIASEYSENKRYPVNEIRLISQQ